MAGHNNDQHISMDDLSAYADGMFLSRGEREVIELHLQTCQECRQELESLRLISGLLSDLPEPELPRSFRITEQQAMLQRADQPAPDPEPIQPWVLRYQSAFRYTGLAAALLLVVVLTIDLYPTSGDDSSEPVTMMEAPAVEDSEEEVADEPGVMRVEEEDVSDTPDVDQDAIEDEAVEESAPVDDVPVSEPDEPVDADTPEDADVPAVDGEIEDSDHPVAAVTPQPEDSTAIMTADPVTDEGGVSALQITAMALAAASVLLLGLGFLAPRLTRPRQASIES
jgi:hypothetical protein